jgi:hypothetical protein
MWVLLLLFVLVSGFIGWATWLFLIFAGLLLLFLNMVLLTTLRHMTKGGHVVHQNKVGWTLITFTLVSGQGVPVLAGNATLVVSKHVYV